MTSELFPSRIDQKGQATQPISSKVFNGTENFHTKVSHIAQDEVVILNDRQRCHPR